MSRSEILASKTLGYWSAFGGVEVKEINDDICYCVSNAWGGTKRVHRLKVRYNSSGSPYVILNNSRLRFDDCLRVM